MTDPAAALPDDYPRFLEHLKTQVLQARIRATRVVNTELLTLYWNLGHTIRQRQQEQGWGAKVIDRLSVGCVNDWWPHMTGKSGPAMRQRVELRLSSVHLGGRRTTAVGRNKRSLTARFGASSALTQISAHGTCCGQYGLGREPDRPVQGSSWDGCKRGIVADRSR